uniref:V-type proton ATPase subunit a n=1 Tax=Erpetoichthys calabaricus TaxID=27687 RepID=A0A8C4SXG1_ERPCA
MALIFQSEEMCLVQLFFQSESGYCCISELGELGLVQFKDLNPGTTAFQRKFIKEVRRCEEMERILFALLFFLPDPLQSVIEKVDKDLKEINSSHEALKRNLTELLEMKYLLQMIQDFFEETPIDLPDRLTFSSHSLTPSSLSSLCRFVAGVIKQERFPAFERVLWRVCRGNFFLRHSEIQARFEDPVATVEILKKEVFIIFLQGEQFKGKIGKICEGFGLTASHSKALNHCFICDHVILVFFSPKVLNQTNEHRHNVLTSAAVNIQNWKTKVKKMKAIYHTLNLCSIDITQKLVIAEIWCPVSDLSEIHSALIKGSEKSGSSLHPVLHRIESQQTPPTFNRTTSFTSSFQTIIDSYGVGDYQEINPAPFTIITFPFLFAVMFGDCGHGLIMTLFATWMILQEGHFKRLKNELSDTLFSGRYILLLMGLFSVYTGLIYNDCFSKSLSIFASAWNVRAMFQPTGPWTNHTVHSSVTLQLDPVSPGVFSGSPYPFGIDPIWNLSSNKLTFLNSYKMKMSVIFGVVHMLFGIMLSLGNYIHFREPRNILLQFVPEVTFMLALFGYLVFLIIFKWCAVPSSASRRAPSILLHFINMMMFSYPESSDSFLYGSQKRVQIFLVVTALLMVPWMLLVKPLIILKEQKKEQRSTKELVSWQKKRNSESIQHLEVNMGDVFVHQAIHTIEYCLGCVSNTASYLRLWALSLAHAELSEVLWKMVPHVALSARAYLGSLMLTVIFAIFAILTVTILLIMEGLSAFLHALRLHCKFAGVPVTLFAEFSPEMSQ